MFPIDVTIELNVCARNYEEAVETVKRGLKDGRYADDAKFYFAASRQEKLREAISAIDKYMTRTIYFEHGKDIERWRSTLAKARKPKGGAK